MRTPREAGLRHLRRYRRSRLPGRPRSRPPPDSSRPHASRHPRGPIRKESPLAQSPPGTKGPLQSQRSTRHRRSPGPAPSPPSKRPEASTPEALLAAYRPDLFRALAATDAPTFRYTQVLEHLLRRPLRPFAEASVLPGNLRTRLDELGPSVLSVAATRTGTDGTSKLLLQAGDGSQIEAVLMPYGKRVTVCVSSQVGCAIGCAFCATGALGFLRNLSTAEIVDQMRAAAGVATAAERRITNVVYMGMGEPLLNLGAVLDSIRLLTSPLGFGLGHRSISVSTVGIPNGILRLGRAEPQVNLALSLHATDDATRASLIPEGFRRPLAEVLEAAWEHFAITGRKLLVEYVLLSGVNDSVDDARRLAALLRGHVAAVNLLTWNPVCPEEAEPATPAGRITATTVTKPVRTTAGRSSRSQPQAAARGRPFHPSSPTAVDAFRAVLRAAHIEVVVRQSKGAGIEAACGQLAGALRSYDTD